MGLVAVLVVAALVGVRPADEPVFAMQEREEAQAGGEQAKVLRLTVTELETDETNRYEEALPNGSKKFHYSVVEKDVVDVTVALPLVEFVLLSGIEAWPEVKRTLVEAGVEQAPTMARAILKLVDAVSRERLQAFVDSLKEMKAGTELLVIQIEDVVRIRLWVE